MKVWAKLAPLGLAISSAALLSCGGSGDDVTCIPPPCPVTVVVTLSVTAAGGGPINGVSVVVSSPITANIACTSAGTTATCSIPGFGGTYSLLVEAPGFNSSQQTAVVEAQGDTSVCLCPTLTPQHLNVVLNPAG